MPDDAVARVAIAPFSAGSSYVEGAARVYAAHPSPRDAWVLVELGVLPAYRELGLGMRLHDALLAAQPLLRRRDVVVLSRVHLTAIPCTPHGG